MATDEERLLSLVDRLYRRDRRRFAKLIVWIRTVRKRGYESEYILAALEILGELEGRGEGPAQWWPYLTATLQRTRAQKIHEQHKKGVPNSVRSIMRGVLREALGD